MLLRISHAHKAGTRTPNKHIIAPIFSVLAPPGSLDHAPGAWAWKRSAPALNPLYGPRNALSITSLPYFSASLYSANGPTSAGELSRVGENATACGGRHEKDLARILNSLNIPPDKLDCWSISREVGASKLRHFVQTLQCEGLSKRRVRILLESHPTVLRGEVVDIIRNVDALKRLGFRQEELKTHLVSVPELLSAKWVNRYQGIMKLGVEEEVMRRWFKYDPRLFLQVKKSTVQRQLGVLSELGISTEQARKIIRSKQWFLRLKSKDFCIDELNLLRSLGCKDTDIGKVITQDKAFFGYTLERHLQPAVDCLEGLGLKKEEIARVFLASLSLKALCTSKAKEKISLFESYGVDKKNIGKLILWNPAVVRYSLKRKINPTLEYLKREGLQGKDIGDLLIREPRLLGGFTQERFDERDGIISKFGFKEDLSTFFRVLKCTLTLDADEIEARIQNLLNAGFSHQDVHKMVTRLPTILCRSQDQVMQVVEYLVNQFSYSISDIVRVPMSLCYNLEKRIKPRLEMLRWLWAGGLIKEGTPLTSVLLISNQKFLEKFVVPYPEGPAIFQKFSESSVDMHV